MFLNNVLNYNHSVEKQRIKSLSIMVKTLKKVLLKVEELYPTECEIIGKNIVFFRKEVEETKNKKLIKKMNKVVNLYYNKTILP